MPWHRTGRRRWRSDVTGIWRSRASRARSSPRCSAFSGRAMEREGNARILIVDDHEDNVELLRLRLEAWGYRTDTAMDGASALRQVYEAAPDLILLDVMMPEIDGIEVARRIKADAPLPFIPIIMQTALDSIEHKVEGLDAGADDYITKPIHFSELQARVRSLLRIKALQEKVANRERELSEMKIGRATCRERGE